MLSPVQLNTSAHRPIRSARGPIPVRFGGDKNKPVVPSSSNDTYESSVGGLFVKKLESFSTAIKGLHDFGPDKNDTYYNYDFAARYNELTKRAKEHLKKLLAHLEPEDMEKQKKANELGPLEEGSDMDWEAATLCEMRLGIITDKMVKKWANDVLPDSNQAARQDKSFTQFLAEVKRDIPQKQVDKFAKEMGWDSPKAQEALLLMAAKFTLMRSRDYKYEIWKDNKHLLMGEEEELRETFSRFSPRKVQCWLLSATYTYIPGLISPKTFQSQVRGMVSGRLNMGIKIKNEDLLGNVFAKQARRQEHDFTHPELKSKDERKQTLKGIEVATESAYLQNAKQGHPIEIAAF